MCSTQAHAAPCERQTLVTSTMAGVASSFCPLPTCADKLLLCLCCCRWTWTGVPLITPPGAAGAPNALLHYTFAPLFMKHMQPLHTPGLQGKWGNSSMWPGVQTVLSSLHSKQAAASGRIAVDFSAAQDLFLPRYQAWKAAQAAQAAHSSSPAGVDGSVSEAITLEQVLMTLDAVMVPLHQQEEAGVQSNPCGPAHPARTRDTQCLGPSLVGA